MSPRITVVYGTRPEAIKLAPLVRALRTRKASLSLICSGQHTSLLDPNPLPPDRNLGLAAEGHPYEYAARLAAQLYGKFDGSDLVVVQGDTATAFAGCLAAHAEGRPIAHVEAGIRTHVYDDPWPEEFFRVQVDKRATWHFCATQNNLDNLWNEGIPGGIVTGNTGIDALYDQLALNSIHDELPQNRTNQILITLHRRESHGEPLQRIIQGLLRAAEEHRNITFLWPTHPNPEVQKSIPEFPPENFCIVPPMVPDSFIGQVAHSRAVVTDSGGVQEEAAALGIPAVIARDHTDRPESVEAGLALLAGRSSEGVDKAIATVLDWPPLIPSICFGDGHASERIAQILLGD